MDSDDSDREIIDTDGEEHDKGNTSRKDEWSAGIMKNREAKIGQMTGN